MPPLLRSLVPVAILLLSACATAPVPRLAVDAREDEKAVAVVLWIEQSEISVDDVNVNAGGGLIGALIEAGIESTMARNRQRALGPLRDALVDFDLETTMTEALRAHWPDALVRDDGRLSVVRNREQWLGVLEGMVPARILLLRARYAFLPDFDIAYVAIDADLSHYPRIPPEPAERNRMSSRERKAAEPTPVHRGRYFSSHVRSPLFGPGGREKGTTDFQVNATRWAEDGALALRHALRLGANEVAGLLQRDGRAAVPEVPEPLRNGPRRPRAMLVNIHGTTNLPYVDLLERRDDRSLVRFVGDVHWVGDGLIWP